MQYVILNQLQLLLIRFIIKLLMSPSLLVVKKLDLHSGYFLQ